MAKAYYNEINKFAAARLEDLINDGRIPPGVVDTRDIRDVPPSDLDGYTQLHFFAGIGGWPYALRLAGWPDDRPVTTGSCPCQPFSNAGLLRGIEDDRHLWPAFRWILGQRRRTTVLGEQVASKAGRKWLTGVRSDLEAMGHVVGAADLCAASIGTPYIRPRLWLVAHPDGTGLPKLKRPPEEREGAGPDRFPLPIDWGIRNPAKTFIRRGVHGIPGRVGAVKAFGNAIVPQLAAEFIKASVEAINDVLS